MADLKLLCFITRRPDFTLAQFSQYWRTTHKAHALKLVEPGYMQGYIQNHRLARQPGGLSCPFDGSPELWIERIGALADLAASPEYLNGAGPDEPNFMTGGAVNIVAEEVALNDPPKPARWGSMVKAMLLFRRAPALNQAQFRARCAERRHPLVLPGSASLGLTRQFSLEDPAQGMERAAYDLVECSWWPDADSFIHAWAHRDSRPAAAIVAEEQATGMLVQEELVLAPV